MPLDGIATRDNNAHMDLTPKACAERYDVHVETVRRWIRQDLLPASRSRTGRYRVQEADLVAFLAAGKPGEHEG